MEIRTMMEPVQKYYFEVGTGTRKDAALLNREIRDWLGQNCDCTWETKFIANSNLNSPSPGVGGPADRAAGVERSPGAVRDASSATGPSGTSATGRCSRAKRSRRSTATSGPARARRSGTCICPSTRTGPARGPSTSSPACLRRAGRPGRRRKTTMPS